MKRVLGTSLMLIMSMFLLYACGGGGGGSSSSSGSVFPSLGPISGADVFVVDTSGDNTNLTLPISIGKTNTDGALTSLKNLSQFNSSHYPLVLSVENGATKLGNFEGQLKGLLDSPTSKAFITPASSLVVNLVESGKTPSEAKTVVRTYVQNTMGFGEEVDPLGDFTASSKARQQIEIAQYALMGLIGVSNAVENTPEEQQKLTSNIKSLATKIASGSSFGSAVNEINPSVEATGVSTFVKNNIPKYREFASTALDENIPDEDVPSVDDTKDTAEAFKITGASAGSTFDQTGVTDEGNKYTVETGSTNYIAVSMQASDGSWDTPSDASFEFVSVPSEGNFTKGGSPVESGDTDQAADQSSAPVYKFEAPAATTSAKLTIRSLAPGVGFSRTVTFDVVDAETTVAADEFVWQTGGTNLLEFMNNDSTADDKLTAGDSLSFGFTDFAAALNVLGTTFANDKASVNDQYAVSFKAPEGFKFKVQGDETLYSNYDLATFEALGDGDYEAIIDSTMVSIEIDEEKEFGPYNFTAKLINKESGAVELTTGKSMYAITSDYRDMPAEVTNVQYNGNSNATMETTDGLVSLSDSFSGEVKTWSDVASDVAASATGLNGNWYLLAEPASSGDYGFTSDSQAEAVDNYDLGTASTSSSPVSFVEGSLKFSPNTAVNADSITLQYIDSHNGINITSNGGFTLRTK